MGLNIVVGILIGAEEDYADDVRQCFAVIQGWLARTGAGQWAEPDLGEEDDLEYEAWGYRGVHTLRRVAVHLAATGALPPPLRHASEATGDRLLKQAYASGPPHSAGPFDHLVWHSDCDGYYVPVDFEQVIADDSIAGGYLGSSVRLLAETRRIAGVLGLPEDLDPESEEVFATCGREIPGAVGWQRYGVESYTCLQLIRAAKHSVATGAAIALAAPTCSTRCSTRNCPGTPRH
ncbi:MAG: hypothetical protein FWE35_22535 [Streptosporangiales bacterium]|nr:hypothetical protein [Streptosporangiales bacterium]